MYSSFKKHQLLTESWRRFLNEEIDRMLFEETYGYKEFLADDQAIFKPGVSYEEYVSSLGNKVPKDKASIWLYNHHAAELAWEQGFPDKAKKHIALAAKTNPYGNSITDFLDFVMNERGTYEELKDYIEQNIKDPTEKETALSLLNNEHYGQMLKNK